MYKIGYYCTSNIYLQILFSVDIVEMSNNKKVVNNVLKNSGAFNNDESELNPYAEEYVPAEQSNLNPYAEEYVPSDEMANEMPQNGAGRRRRGRKSRKASRKAQRKSSRKTSRRASRKASRRASRKASRKSRKSRK